MLISCPQCGQALSSPRSGQRQACAFCGWVQEPPKSETAEEPFSRKAEEIASQTEFDAAPIWRNTLLVVGLLSLLVIGFNSLVGAFQKPRGAKRQDQSLSSQSGQSGQANPSADSGLQPQDIPSLGPANGAQPVATASPPAEEPTSPTDSVDPQTAASAIENGQEPSGSPSSSPASEQTSSPEPSASPEASASPPSGILITPPP